MKKYVLKLLALVLALTLLLSGCSRFGLPVPFGEMKYNRPDVSALEQKLNAVTEMLPEAKSAKQIMNAFYDFYYTYLEFATSYSLAYIHYCQDLTDIYWEQEYNYCMENTSWVDAGYDQLLYDLAKSPFVEELESDNYFGAGFFDDYQGESMWDDTLIELIGQEDALLSEYYALSAEPADGSEAYLNGTGAELARVFVELVAQRQKIARHAGYPDYPSFAYDFYHTRDYTPQQARDYTEQIREQLTPLYRQTAELEHWAVGYEECTQAEALAYVSFLARQMGGVVRQAYDTMLRFDMYDIKMSENKYDASFELYLYAYNLPFIFVNSTGTVRDKLTLTHEFGHFCRDYSSYGYALSIDVMEVFSQGMENLSLFYAPEGEKLRKLRLQDSLNVFVEQAAYASFEQQVYGLTGEGLTVESVDALYTEVMEDFGLDIWGVEGRDYVLLPHIFISPMYLISYIVSNDAALQLYQMEAEQSGAGLEAYERCLATQQEYFLAFVEENGLENPFAPGRLETIRKTFEEALLS